MEYGTDNDWITIQCGDPSTYPEPGQTIIYVLSERPKTGWGKLQRERNANSPCIGRVVKDKSSYVYARVGADNYKQGYEVPYDITRWMPAPSVLRNVNVPPHGGPGVWYLICILSVLAVCVIFGEMTSNVGYSSEEMGNDGYVVAEEHISRAAIKEKEEFQAKLFFTLLIPALYVTRRLYKFEGKLSNSRFQMEPQVEVTTAEVVEGVLWFIFFVLVYAASPFLFYYSLIYYWPAGFVIMALVGYGMYKLQAYRDSKTENAGK